MLSASQKGLGGAKKQQNSAAPESEEPKASTRGDFQRGEAVETPAGRVT